MTKVTCVIIASLLAICLADYPPKQLLPYHAPKPAIVYGTPYEIKYVEPKVPVTIAYKYKLPPTPVKPAEVYGVPSKPAFVYGVPEEYPTVELAKIYTAPKKTEYKPVTSSYKYKLVDEPKTYIAAKPHEIYGLPYPTYLLKSSYGLPL